MMHALTLSLIQTATHWHAPARNRALFDDWFHAVPDAADIVVLPEMFSTGFTMEAERVAEPMDGPTLAWLIDAAAGLRKIVCASLVIREGGACFNRFVWVQPDGTVHHYDKRHLFRMAGEHEHYAPGSAPLTVECNGWRIRPFVCYDLRFPVWLRNRDEYDLLLGVANWPAARQLHWSTLLRARAIENLSFAAAVNCLGRDGNGVEYRGGSAVYGPQGEAQLEVMDEAGVFTVCLDPEALRSWRERFPADRDADRYEILS
jgi:omega-amidase